MNRSRGRRAAAAVMGAALVGAAVLGVEPLHAAAAPRASSVVPGTELWVDLYDGPGHQGAEARAVAVDPVDGTVFVTGYGKAPGVDRIQIVTMAYSPDGVRLWLLRYGEPTDGNAGSDAIVVDPVSRTVYVAGNVASLAHPHDSDFVTIAYSMSGVQLWAHRYNGHYGPPSDSLYSVDRASSIAIDSSNHNVYVSGIRELTVPHPSGNLSERDYATVAYAADGTRLWSKRFVRGRNVGDPGRSGDNRLEVDNYPHSLAVDPANHNLYLTGSSLSAAGDPDYVTVAYGPDGSTLWVNWYTGLDPGWDGANAVAVDPGNHNIYVTGKSSEPGPAGKDSRDEVTLAYRPDGSTVWARRFRGPHLHNYDSGVSIAVDTANHNVFTAGYTDGDTNGSPVQGLNVLVNGYSADGRPMWFRLWNSYHFSSLDEAAAVAVNSVSHEVVLTGRAGLSNNDSAMVTMSYDESGTRQWASTYETPTNALRDYGEAIAVDETRHMVYAVGLAGGNCVPGPSTCRWIVIAYSGGS
jgi:hypothetical protein